MMKKKILLFGLTLIMVLALIACDKDTAETGTDKNADSNNEIVEQEVVRWNYGNSGNLMVILAEEKGYFNDEGISIEEIPATNNADAMTLLSTGQVDVASNAGTSNPLQQIASGVDLTIFGGHMVDGSMPIIALKGTEWNRVESLIDKKFACNPSYFALTGAVMELGYEDPLSALEWITYDDYNDAIAAVVQGEVDYALLGTGHNYQAKNMEEIEIVAYQGDVMENYSCCRLVAQSDFIKDNPNTVKGIMKALIRAQAYYESNKEETTALVTETIDVTEEYVDAYIYNEDYIVHSDPLKNPVVRAWDILNKTGFLSENAQEIDILDHVNIDIYKTALDEVIEVYGDQDPEFYDSMLSFYEENNS